MKSMPTPSMGRIKQVLEDQKGRIEKQLQRLKKDDPFLASDRSVIDEPGTVSFEEEGHTRIESNIKESEKLLQQVKKALSKIGIGKYGQCDICSKAINPKRLEAFPMATLCLSCEQKKERRL